MSTSPARRRRLRAIRALPQAVCSCCGTRLDRVDFPLRHLKRCEEIAARAAEAPVAGAPR
jgi:hypothetical protein